MKETEEILIAFCDIVSAIKKSKEDGKITITDWPNFVPTLKPITKAIAGANEIKREWETRTEEEMQEIVDLIREKFDIDNDILEAWIEDAAELILNIADLIDRGIKIF